LQGPDLGSRSRRHIGGCLAQASHRPQSQDHSSTGAMNRILLGNETDINIALWNIRAVKSRTYTTYLGLDTEMNWDLIRT